MSYNEFKNSLVLNLTERFPEMDIASLNRILQIIDCTANDYDFTRKCTDLIVSGGVPEVLKLYLAAKVVEGYSKGTLYNAQIICTNFFQTVGKPIDRITSNDIRVFLYTWQNAHNVSLITLDKYRVLLSTFFHWCCAEGYIEKDPTAVIKPFKAEKKQRESLTQVELEYMRKACQDIREKALIEFMYSTGCRAAEVCEVKRSDVNFDTGEVHLFGKGKKHRTSYLNAKASVNLKEYLDSRIDDCPYLFVRSRRPVGRLTTSSIAKIVRDIAARANLTKHVSPHIIRHTTATQAVKHGMLVQEVQKLLGHANIATTMVYVETDDSEIRAMHNRAVI